MRFYILLSLSVLVFTGVIGSVQAYETKEASDESENLRPIHLPFRYYNEGPLYDKIVHEFEKELVIEELPNERHTIGIHEIDLNGDSIPEYIVRLENMMYHCNEMGCHNGIVAITGDEVKRLGYFEYTELDVSQNETDGVKDILSYDNPLNDYTASVYKWDTQEQYYVKQNIEDEE